MYTREIQSSGQNKIRIRKTTLCWRNYFVHVTKLVYKKYKVQDMQTKAYVGFCGGYEFERSVEVDLINVCLIDLQSITCMIDGGVVEGFGINRGI